MKNILFIIALLSVSYVASAQISTSESTSDTSFENERPAEMEYLSSNGGSHGVYFGMGSSLAHLGKSNFVSFDSRLAYVADQKFEFGIGSSVFHNIDNLATIPDSSTYIAGGMGGLHLKAIFRGNEKIHFSIPVMFGGGAASVFSDYDHFNSKEVDFDEESWEAFLFVEPGVNLELNINRIVGFEFGAKYLITTNSSTNTDYYENLNGFKIQAMLKIGFFGFGKNKVREPERSILGPDGDYLDL